MATMTMLGAKCLSINTPKQLKTLKPVSLISLRNLPKGLITFKTSKKPDLPTSFTGTAIAGAIFSVMSSSEPALAVQQIAQIAEGDNRGLALLLPIIPAVLWVLYNILQPALNQLNRMRNKKGIIVGLGLGGLAASGHFFVPSASAGELAAIAEASNDNRGLILLIVVTPAILWVLYNILQPALNQINRMRSE
ncbi:Photosystem II PsbY [Dillenia turbinata]|uniref:Photosystem II PsbY n=1 Tax=Dillenia turbinata TaxID=194707 RepID=A0AAN8URF6_9MAGN